MYGLLAPMTLDATAYEISPETPAAAIEETASGESDDAPF
jgi:hypothetical protein